jgi:hypothetical protein
MVRVFQCDWDCLSCLLRPTRTTFLNMMEALVAAAPVAAAVGGGPDVGLFQRSVPSRPAAKPSLQPPIRARPAG